MQTAVIYMTAGSVDEARKIADELIAKRLCACVNIFPPIESVYYWNNAVQRNNEVAFIAKTRQSLVPQVIEEVKKLHSYEVPCVVSLPIERGNPHFLQWILDETRDCKP
ncbi:MAG: divalent-cation tolerance protein CutA [Desulfatibacillaceae bacterium]|nr:divalent-cation tolerance protein CutA [Desulfatibacillaceae bacterium]